MPALYTVTRRTIRTEIARAIGDLVQYGTADSATSTTLVDTELFFINDDELNGLWVVIHTGTGLGQERQISDFVASSDTMTVVPAWTTTPDSTSQYDIYRRFRLADYNDAIAAAHRAVSHLHLLYRESREHVLGSWVKNGNFWLWANGASAAPDGFTLSGGSVSQETAVGGYPNNLYSAKLLATVSNGRLTQTLLNPGSLFGETITFKALVLATEASIASVAISDTVDNFGTVNSAAGRVELSVERKVAVTSDGLVAVILRNTSSSAPVFFLKCWLEGGPDRLEYDVPSDMLSIHSLEYEGDDGEFPHIIDPRQWDLVQGSPSTSQYAAARIRFRPDWFSIPQRRTLIVKGQGEPNGPTSDTGNLEVNPEFVKAYAAWYLARTKPDLQGLALSFKAEADRMMILMASHFMPNSRIVEPN